MSDTANVVGRAAVADEAAVNSSRPSLPSTGATAALQPVFPAASNGEPLPDESLAPTATTGTSEAETDPELLKQQLQLIQLCFAEHEFGIVVNEKGRKDNSSSSSSFAASSSPSSPSRSSSSESSVSSPQVSKSGATTTAAAAALPRTQHGIRRLRHRPYSNYDPLAFVNGKVQHGVPLPVLSQDLHAYAQYLEDKIATCVNTDVHTAFVNVSGHLVGMRDELSYMERPLAAAMEKLSGAVSQLSTASLGLKNKVEAACAAEMERSFDAMYLRGIVVYETMAFQLDDLAQLLRMTTNASPGRRAATSTTTATTAGAGAVASSGADGAKSALDDAAGKGGSGARKDLYSITGDTQLTDAALDILEDVVLLFQELKGVNHRLVSLPSRQQEKADMAVYVAAAEQSVMGVLEAVLVHVSRLTLGFTAAAASAAASTMTGAGWQSGGGGASAMGVAPDAGPSLAARQLLGRIVELYSQAGEREQFCAVFRNAVLRPPLEAVVSWKAATQARQSADGTVALLEQMKAVLRTKYLPLLPLLRENYGAPLFPVATIVWPILSETLVKKLPSLYEVGIPNQFQIKYKAAYGVLALAEAACADLDELAALRQSPDVVLWNHKWNLDVYAALRVSEVDKALQCVSSPLDRLPPSSSPNGGYHLRLFYIVHQQLLNLFSPDVYLYMCTPRFLRQTVTCCYRVLQHVQEAIVRASAAGAGGNSSSGEREDNANQGSRPENGAGAADSMTSDTLLLAIADTHTLRSFLIDQLLPLILQRLEEDATRTTAAPSSPPTADSTTLPPSSSAPAAERSTASLVTDVIAFASRTVCDQFVQQARATLVRHVTGASMGPLQNVKSVRSAYSHTRKTTPSAASWYVAPALQPLQRFVEEAQRCGFAGAACEESVVEMLHAVVKQFVLLAKDTLITAKKTEESWEKLRRRKEGGGGSVGAGGSAEAAVTGDGTVAPASGQRVTMETATDRDKMTIQLWMDARALLQAVQQPPLNLGEAAATAAFAPAFDLLRRAEWIQGADIPEPPDVDA